ncbi:MAG: amidase family protein [Candidatus Diapherotrites archaeon]|nr:amidase family protein [Candidatus Diapherotrites archaeon]
MNILDEARVAKEKFGLFNALNPDGKESKKGRLAGIGISVKDNICVAGMPATAGSAILSNYVPVYNATVIEKVLVQGATIVGKTSQDEFGFGTFSTNIGTGLSAPKNPLDPSRSCGGSSGGAAGFTRFATAPHIALGQSTGGSIACPAAFCGVVGFTPTYGRVSRYGLIDYANSLDKIGTLGKTVSEAALLLEIISGHDPRDSTSAEVAVPALSKAKPVLKGKTLGVVTEFFGKGIDFDVSNACKDAIAAAESQGAKIKEISLSKNSEFGIPAYYLIAMAESSTNLARYCGMRYGETVPLSGHFDEYFSAVRSKFFGTEAKRRIILGTFARMSGYRDAYYLRALKARSVLLREYADAFESCDVLVHPTMPFVAPRFDDITKLSPMQHYAADLCTVPSNLAGLPHLSLPVQTKSRLPAGLLLTAPHFSELELTRITLGIEQAVKK